MINVVFVCLGNICRSPMAELVLKHMAEEEGLKNSFNITSYGTSDWEVGNPVYPPAQKVLKAHGIKGGHRAQKLSLRDVLNADYVLVMDGQNYADVLALTSGNHKNKVFLLRSFMAEGGDIADPWYTRDFEGCFSQIAESCKCFLDYIKREHAAELLYDTRH